MSIFIEDTRICSLIPWEFFANFISSFIHSGVSIGGFSKRPLASNFSTIGNAFVDLFSISHSISPAPKQRKNARIEVKRPNFEQKMPKNILNAKQQKFGTLPISFWIIMTLVPVTEWTKNPGSCAHRVYYLVMRAIHILSIFSAKLKRKIRMKQ